MYLIKLPLDPGQRLSPRGVHHGLIVKRLFHAPHRFFFFAGVVQLLLASGWWGAALFARAGGLPPPLAAGLDAVRVHAYLMLYGFFPLITFGFLFTAGPRWLGVAPPAVRDYAPAGVAASLAALAFFPALALGPAALGAAIVAHLAAWLSILARFVGLIRASPAEDRTHALVAAGAIALGVSGSSAMVAGLATGSNTAFDLMETLGLWGFLVPLFATVCHRMIPFFTAGVHPFLQAWRPRGMLAALVGGSVLHGMLAAFGAGPSLALVDAPLGVLVLYTAVRWGFAERFSHRLLAMLHVGFAWLGVALLLHAAQALLALSGRVALGQGPVHAATVGFLASLTMAMVSRVSRGHSGRELAADNLTWTAFLLLQAAAFARIAADLWLTLHAALLPVAATLWLAAFAAWAWRYLPYYCLPRADGRPG